MFRRTPKDRTAVQAAPARKSARTRSVPLLGKWRPPPPWLQQEGAAPSRDTVNTVTEADVEEKLEALEQKLRAEMCKEVSSWRAHASEIRGIVDVEKSVRSDHHASVQELLAFEKAEREAHSNQQATHYDQVNEYLLQERAERDTHKTRLDKRVDDLQLLVHDALDKLASETQSIHDSLAHAKWEHQRRYASHEEFLAGHSVAHERDKETLRERVGVLEQTAKTLAGECTRLWEAISGHTHAVTGSSAIPKVAPVTYAPVPVPPTAPVTSVSTLPTPSLASVTVKRARSVGPVTNSNTITSQAKPLMTLKLQPPEGSMTLPHCAGSLYALPVSQRSSALGSPSRSQTTLLQTVDNVDATYGRPISESAKTERQVLL